MVSVVMTTTSGEDEASHIADVLVGDRYAACAHILPRIESVYWWEEKMQRDEESVLIVKTTKRKVESVIKKIKELHTYEVPEIIAFESSNACEVFEKYVLEEVK